MEPVGSSVTVYATNTVIVQAYRVQLKVWCQGTWSRLEVIVILSEAAEMVLRVLKRAFCNSLGRRRTGCCITKGVHSIYAVDRELQLVVVQVTFYMLMMTS